MMNKRYKLIKEYPGSLKPGSRVTNKGYKYNLICKK